MCTLSCGALYHVLHFIVLMMCALHLLLLCTAAFITYITALPTPNRCCTHAGSYCCRCYHYSVWQLYLPHIGVVPVWASTAAAMIASLLIQHSCCTHVGSRTSAAATSTLHDCFTYLT